ncbi:LLM class flavin-dependent oxidoreductase (plasmid) [Halorussus salilacus]|uniref:LLM class flavin-dependent oxidoreductase n=1 Tax=Halorussus salilacus TaxID=2953750 RepID=UPI0020A09BC5|nr:LLM class flavin-dependent oxidoreductase [Halorussus salilacus]USZ70179.1 LLM class flavin-dependent oxidoreductase [Halorussus salilacus]
MRFGVNVPTSAGASEYSMLAFCDSIDWKKQRGYARLAESVGFDGVAVPDHLMTGDGATTECLSTLTALARETETVTLFPKTINNELRHGPLLAKAAATIDNVSDGRFKLGMGAGWKEDEALAFGYDWPDAPDRLRAMEETIELTKRLWTEDSVTYEGDYYELRDAVSRPHPTQDPHPPVMVGGGGEEFTLRIVAKHADEWNYWGPPEVIEQKLDVLAAHCETYGTDFDEIDTSWFARCIVRETEEEVDAILDEVPRFRDPDEDDPLSSFNNLIGTPEQVAEELRAYEELGVDEVVLEFVDFPESTGIELFADRVMPEFR